MTNQAMPPRRQPLTSEVLAELVDPQHTAVVVVDVQRLFTDLFPYSHDPPLDLTLANMSRFLNHARETDVPIVFVRTIIQPHQHSKNTLDWPEYMRSNLAPGSPGIEFEPKIAPRPGEIELVKTRYSSFIGTSLHKMLRDRDVETVIAMGITTDVCVASTIRDAWQLDYRTITLSDCCTAGTESHEAGLKILGRNFGHVCTSGEVVAAWQPHVTVTT